MKESCEWTTNASKINERSRVDANFGLIYITNFPFCFINFHGFVKNPGDNNLLRFRDYSFRPGSPYIGE